TCALPISGLAHERLGALVPRPARAGVPARLQDPDPPPHRIGGGGGSRGRRPPPFPPPLRPAHGRLGPHLPVRRRADGLAPQALGQPHGARRPLPAAAAEPAGEFLRVGVPDRCRPVFVRGEEWTSSRSSTATNSIPTAWPAGWPAASRWWPRSSARRAPSSAISGSRRTSGTTRAA